MWFIISSKLFFNINNHTDFQWTHGVGFFCLLGLFVCFTFETCGFLITQLGFLITSTLTHKVMKENKLSSFAEDIFSPFQQRNKKLFLLYVGSGKQNTKWSSFKLFSAIVLNIFSEKNLHKTENAFMHRRSWKAREHNTSEDIFQCS